MTGGRRIGCSLVQQQRGQRRQPHFARQRLGVGEQRSALAFDEIGVEVGVAYRARIDEPREEAEVVARADEEVLAQRLAQAREGLIAVRAVRDELGDHRIVVRGDLVACVDAGIEACARHRGGLPPMQDATGRGQEAASRVFGVQPQLDRMAVEAHFVLGER